MKAHELKIEGMTCGHCVMSVKKELSKIADLIVADVQIGSARVQYDERKINPEILVRAIYEAGNKLVSIE